LPPVVVTGYGEPMVLRLGLGRSQIGVQFCAIAFLGFCAGFAAFAQAPDRDGFQGLLQQGFQLHQQARFLDAIPVLERARKLEPGDYFANLLLGIDLLRTGKTAEAIPRLQLAARARPGEEFPEDYLGEAEATLGHQALAAEAFQQAVLRGHNSEQALEAWAGFALERFRQIGEDLRASEQEIETAQRLQKAASDPEPAGASGCAATIPALERKLALKQAHTDTDTVYKLSICYAMEAGNVAARLQSGAEDAAAVHRLRGDVLLRLKGDASAAQSEYREAIVIRANDPGLLERLAEAQMSAGDTEGARQSAQAALSIDPHQRGALRTLSALAMSNRDYDQALPWLRQLVKEAPGDRAAQVELGRALAQTGMSAEALQWLAPALTAGYPDEKGALHALMARVLRKLGRDDEAEKAEAEARHLSDAYQARGGQVETGQDGQKGTVHERPDAN
jgi:predicted Zn-dependent protease